MHIYIRARKRDKMPRILLKWEHLVFECWVVEQFVNHQATIRLDWSFPSGNSGKIN